jgi:hypothetical protein
VQKVIQAIQSGQQLPRREIPDSQPVLFQQGSEV